MTMLLLLELSSVVGGGVYWALAVMCSDDVPVLIATVSCR